MDSSSSSDEEECSTSSQLESNLQISTYLDLRAHDAAYSVSTPRLETASEGGGDSMQAGVPDPPASTVGTDCAHAHAQATTREKGDKGEEVDCSSVQKASCLTMEMSPTAKTDEGRKSCQTRIVAYGAEQSMCSNVRATYSEVCRCSLESENHKDACDANNEDGYETDSSIESLWWCTGNRLPRSRGDDRRRSDRTYGPGPVDNTFRDNLANVDSREIEVGSSLPHGYLSLSSCRPYTATESRELKSGKHIRIPGVYLFTFPNNKKYAGQTVWPNPRWNRYKNGKFNKCRALKAAIDKYGWDSIKKEWLHGGPGNTPIAEECLDQLEIDAIAEHNTVAPNGYNIQPGGKVAWKGAEGLARKGPRGPRTQETIAKIKSTWDEKREKRLSEIDTEVARRARNHAATQSASRKAKKNGTFFNKRFQPNDARKLTWKLKREEKLALLPPEERDAERERLERNADYRMKAYYARRVPPGTANIEVQSKCESNEY